ncbi:MAG: hypothetical protein CMJ74_01135 [Planctomycetaceae bacterium]|nr:hypothetical protein [Planctomycetaceae bacterium]
MSTVAHPGCITKRHRNSSENFSPVTVAPATTGSSPTAIRRSAPFSESAHRDLSSAAQELAQEIDRYKFRHRRRFINYEEILSVVKTLGYRKDLT